MKIVTDIVLKRNYKKRKMKRKRTRWNLEEEEKEKIGKFLVLD